MFLLAMMVAMVCEAALPAEGAPRSAGVSPAPFFLRRRRRLHHNECRTRRASLRERQVLMFTIRPTADQYRHRDETGSSFGKWRDMHRRSRVKGLLIGTRNY